MKKYIFCSLIALITCSAFSNSTIPDWDKPLVKRTDPYVDAIQVYKRVSDGRLVVFFYVPNYTDNQYWKAKVDVKYRLGAWLLIATYEIIVPPYTNYGYGDFPILSGSTYIWAPGQAPAPSGNYVVDPSQVNMEWWMPI